MQDRSADGSSEQVELGFLLPVLLVVSIAVTGVGVFGVGVAITIGVAYSALRGEAAGLEWLIVAGSFGLGIGMAWVGGVLVRASLPNQRARVLADLEGVEVARDERYRWSQIAGVEVGVVELPPEGVPSTTALMRLSDGREVELTALRGDAALHGDEAREREIAERVDVLNRLRTADGEERSALLRARRPTARPGPRRGRATPWARGRPPSRWAQWWLAFLLFPLGWLAWGSLVYAGVRVGRRRWVAAGGVYLVLAGLLVTVAVRSENAVDSIVVVVSLCLWAVVAVHALLIRREFVHRLRLRELAAEVMTERRVAADLSAEDPRLARLVGIGRPDRAGAAHAGLVDVNRAPAETLVTLPRIDRELAGQILATRPFSSVEDLGLALDLPAESVEELRDVTVFSGR